MAAYYDSSVLIALYVVEECTDAVTAFTATRAEPVMVHDLHALEAENGLRAKVFRKEMTEKQCRQVLARIAEDTTDGRLVRRPVNWYDVFAGARRLSAELTARCGCRSLDLLHIAAALHWRCAPFVSSDDRQLRAAALARLEVLDVRGPCQVCTSEDR
jgi:predicted nucleic acid-binding protein